MLPWELKAAYRETCLCASCENLKLYMEGLHVLAKEVLGPLVQCDECEQDLPLMPQLMPDHDGRPGEPDEDEDEPTSTDERTAPKPVDLKLKALVDLCATPLKSVLINTLVCGGNILTAKAACIAGDCGDCGMQRFWSGPQGYRRQLVEYSGPNKGALKADAPLPWRHELRWERLKKGASKEKPADGSKEADASGKEPLRETVRGNAVQLLDEFEERMSKKAVGHRRVQLDTAAAARACRQNAWLGMLLSDYDWAENGVLELARQIQSEYWGLVAYSLFISITSYLIPSFWKDRTSELPRKAEVTVEPEGLSVVDAEVPAAGSFYAMIDAGSTAAGYSVVDANGVPVPGLVARERLRHRRWDTTAFVGFTNEKRHDGASSQHMINWQLKNYWAPRAAAAKDAKAATTSPEASPATVTTAATAAPPAASPGCRPIITPATPISAVRTSVPSPAIADRRFKQWLLEQDMSEFWCWVGHSDNATHFKSGKMFHYWSNLTRDIEFVKMVWINFGCPGHGKGPWDGFGAVVKTKVRCSHLSNQRARAPIGCHAHTPHRETNSAVDAMLADPHDADQGHGRRAHLFGQGERLPRGGRAR